MGCEIPEQTEQAPATPHSDLAAYLIARNYKALGCDNWDTRRVNELLAKLGETPAILAARLRVRPGELRQRMADNRWSAQDRLILTMIEREIDFRKGGMVPNGSLFAGAI